MSQELNNFSTMLSYCEGLSEENGLEAVREHLFPAMYVLPVTPIEEQQLLKTIALRLKTTTQAVKAEWKLYKVTHPDETNNEKETQADKLVKLAGNIELFHDADKLPFVAVEKDGHQEIYKLRSKNFRAYLQRAYYEQHGRAASTQATQDALATLEGNL